MNANQLSQHLAAANLAAVKIQPKTIAINFGTEEAPNFETFTFNPQGIEEELFFAFAKEICRANNYQNEVPKGGLLERSIVEIGKVYLDLAASLNLLKDWKQEFKAAAIQEFENEFNFKFQIAVKDNYNTGISVYEDASSLFNDTIGWKFEEFGTYRYAFSLEDEIQFMSTDKINFSKLKHYLNSLDNALRRGFHNSIEINSDGRELDLDTKEVDYFQTCQSLSQISDKYFENIFQPVCLSWDDLVEFTTDNPSWFLENEDAFLTKRFGQKWNDLKTELSDEEAN